ncbi:MAG: type II and III secretion system protein family protein [Candidatus Loosdrechtia sp.]|uniref:type II and III secretion system protein family protein n=1 Tax=Candidatus Loosdrechtia sp. TaxID=3101272 RepID=UPI003A77C177|nr:MAG: type II and III secretion system protein family protein [Candidatus Jettenia sp. AMX2]
MVNRRIASCRNGVSLLLILAFCLSVSFPCRAKDTQGSNARQAQKLQVTAGKSAILESRKPIKRVSLAEAEAADIMVLTPQQIYITGKKPGVTSLILWDEADKPSEVYDLEVLPDINRLKEKIHRMFPGEDHIQVAATHNSITLSGTVSSTANLSMIMDLARTYAPVKDGEPQVNNFLQAGGVHQVMLEVRVSEMSRTLMRRLGVNFNFITDSGKFGISVLDNLVTASTFGATERINMIFRFLSGGATWTMFVDALKEQGLLKILAEPTLITLSGKTAHFLAGGEFPVPIPQSGAGIATAPTITIEYKPFGVGLNFTPTVLSNGKINMRVSPEVSELDFANAISLQGFTIPALTTRRVSTEIELAEGQSFAIAGLLNEQVRQTVAKYPVLGDIPILGVLFRSSQFRKSETELIVIVTPHLVRPVDMAKQTLPTDRYIEPDDMEFYLLGLLEGGRHEKGGRGPLSTRPSPAASVLNRDRGLEGEFGYIVP